MTTPAKRFELFRWKSAKVNIDYHVEFEGHYYSVPHALVRTTVELRATDTLLECYSSNQRVACHAVSHQRGAHTTTPEHMPASHRAHLEWTPQKLIDWGLRIGVSTALEEQATSTQAQPGFDEFGRELPEIPKKSGLHEAAFSVIP